MILKICFNTTGKTNTLKKSLRQFDGFEFDADSSEYKKKLEQLQKVELAKLKGVCEGLQLEKKGAKDAICQRICEFLLSPQEIESPDGEDDEDDDGEEEEVPFIELY